MCSFENMQKFMNSKIRSTKRSMWLTIAMFGLLLVGAGSLFINNRGMLDDIRAERVSSESILHERNFALQEIRILKNEIARLNDEKSILSEKSIQDQQTVYQVGKINSSLTRELSRLTGLENVIAALEAENKHIENSYKDVLLQSKSEEQTHERLMAEFNKKENDIIQLSEKLDEYTHRAVLFHTEARRSLGGKTTVHARKAHAMHVEFTLAKGTLPQNAPLYITLTDLSQNIGIVGKELPLTIPVDGGNVSIQPVALARWEGKGAADRMELDFKLDKKIPAGIYQVDVYSDARYLGGARLRLQ
jgi:hypothetical protein